MHRCSGVRAWIGVGVMLVALITACVSHAAEPPAPPRRSDVVRVLDAAREARPSEAAARPLTIVLLADRKDHGENQHDYPRWQARWALLLGGRKASESPAANLFGPDVADPAVQEGAPGVQVICTTGWPGPEEWDAADLVVAYCYLKWNDSRWQEVGRFLGRGGGLVVIHAATWTRPEPSPDVAKLIGVGGFRRYRHGALTLEVVRQEDPICRGLPAHVRWIDEPYWPPTPELDRKRVAALAGSHEQMDSDAESLQPQFWTYAQGKGRVFGCVPGHFCWTFDDPYFRILVLRGMAWAAGENPYRFDELVLRCAALAAD